FDLLFADLAPARVSGCVIRRRGPGVNHVAWADLVQELLRVVGMRRIFHCIQVIEVAEELIEPMDGGQELIEIAEVVLAELPGGVALRFERGGNRASLSWYPDLGARLADCGHPRADGQFAHDEVRATSRATRLGVIVGEQHPFLGDLVEVRCPASHHPTVVGADIPDADIIAHDEDDVWFVAVCRLRCRCDERNEQSDGPLSKYVWFWFHYFLFFSPSTHGLPPSILPLRL